jgi:hypothetical protein
LSLGALNFLGGAARSGETNDGRIQLKRGHVECVDERDAFVSLFVNREEATRLIKIIDGSGRVFRQGVPQGSHQLLSPRKLHAHTGQGRTAHVRGFIQRDGPVCPHHRQSALRKNMGLSGQLHRKKPVWPQKQVVHRLTSLVCGTDGSDEHGAFTFLAKHEHPDGCSLLGDSEVVHGPKRYQTYIACLAFLPGLATIRL